MSHRARSSARLEHRTFNPGVAGSIPVGPAIVPNSFRLNFFWFSFILFCCSRNKVFIVMSQQFFDVC